MLKIIISDILWITLAQKLVLGIVARQAFSNSIYSIIGIMAGAVNTVFIIPRAFEESPDDLGLVKILLSYATIIGSIFGFGLYNIIIRELTDNRTEDYKKSILGYALMLSGIGLGILIVALQLFPNILLKIVNAEEAARLIPNATSLLVLCFFIIFSQFFNSYIITNHKSPFVHFIKDPFLKFSYLILTLYYLIHPFSFDLFVQIFVGLYAFAVVLLFLYSLKLGLSFNFNFKKLDIPALLKFSGYTFLDKGAITIVNNLDIVMIAYLLKFSDAGFYSIAFFIGTVISLPQRAIMTPAYPLVSNFLQVDNKPELQKLYSQTSINQLIIGSVIFALIWINIDDLFQLMPPSFAQGKWVVFYIGLSKIFILSTGISGPIIVLSKFYRFNIIFNIALIIITLTTNYLLINAFGITGAAMGTCLTFAIYNLMKFFFVKSKFDLQPFDISTLKTLFILTVSILLFSFIELDWHPILNMIVKCSIAGILMLLLFKLLKVKAAILDSIWKLKLN